MRDQKIKVLSNLGKSEKTYFRYSNLYKSIIVGFYISLPLHANITWAEENSRIIVSTVQFDLPQDQLSNALQRYSQQSGVQVIAHSDVIQGKTSTTVRGKYTPEHALKILLSNTQLNVNFSQGNTAIISAVSSRDGARVLGTVKVEGNLQEGVSSQLGGVSSSNLSSITGNNGSRDITATEGNKSYAKGNLSIAGRSASEAQKIVQSVSTVNNQQLKDQQAFSLQDALKNVAGISMITDGYGRPTFYSRGFEVENFSIDGSPDRASSDVNQERRFESLSDMSLYDHVEILRGSDSFLGQNNTSTPGGSVNLVRKKPLDHKQLSSDLSFGSWDNRRLSLDLTGPLTQDGQLKGRLIATSVNKGEFWKNGHRENNLVSGDLQYDFNPNSIVSLGFDYGKVNNTPMEVGVPFGSRGEDLHLPRDFSLIQPWAKTSTLQKELRLSFDHNFNPDWSFHLKARRNWANSHYLTSSPNFIGLMFDPAQIWFSQSKGTAKSQSYGIETALLGNIKITNLDQRLELAAQHYSQNASSQGQFEMMAIDVPNLRDFDATQVSIPSFTGQIDSSKDDYSFGNIYLKLDFQPFNSFHILTGPRWQYNRSTSASNKKRSEERLSVPYYAIRYDWTKNWSTYASYTDLYHVQDYLKTEDGSALPPETGSTQELGVKYSNSSKTLTASLGVYDTKRDNIAGFVRGSLPGCCHVIESTKHKSKGIDFEIAGSINSHWSTNLSYTYNKNEYQSGDNDGEHPPLESLFPQHIVKFSNAITGWGKPWLEKLRAGLSVNYVSKEYQTDLIDDDPNNSGSELKSIRMTQDPRIVADIFVGYELTKNLNFQLNLNNVFDERYYTNINGVMYGSRYGEPRNLLFTIQGKF